MHPTTYLIGCIIQKRRNFFLPVAAAKALLNISFSAACVMETIVLVTDVPMLEPKIIGMAFLTGAPAETKATKMQKKKKIKNTFF